MATNDDLDDFFKKKDRKGNKQKKQTTLLTNNEELLKQLEMVTTVTSMFKENMDLDDEEGENNEAYSATTATIDDAPPRTAPKSSKSKLADQVNTHKHLNEQQLNITDSGQQDEWEEFEGFNSNHDQIRLKFLGTTAAHDQDDDYDDDENNPNHHHNDEHNESAADHERNKDKPAWNTAQVKQPPPPPLETTVTEQPTPQAPAPVPAKPSSTGAYRPPQMRGGTSVTVVSGGNSRVTKKKEVNLASTDEFPTLGAAITKK